MVETDSAYIRRETAMMKQTRQEGECVLFVSTTTAMMPPSCGAKGTFFRAQESCGATGWCGIPLLNARKHLCLSHHMLSVYAPKNLLTLRGMVRGLHAEPS